MRRLIMGGIIFNFILLVVFSGFLVMSFGIEDLREVDPLGAAGFPTFVLGLLMVLLLISLINTIKEYTKEKDTHNENKLSKKQIYMVVGLVVLIALFILLLNVIGFFLSILLLTPFVLLVLGERKKLVITLLTIFIPIIFTVLFGVLLGIPLPRGIGIFLEISRLIY